jgi:hypothetical protein
MLIGRRIWVLFADDLGIVAVPPVSGAGIGSARNDAPHRGVAA